MKGWDKQPHFCNKHFYTRRVGDRRLVIFESANQGLLAYAEYGQQSLPLYNGDNLVPWDSPEHAAKALMNRERQRAKQILADLEDPE